MSTPRGSLRQAKGLPFTFILIYGYWRILHRHAITQRAWKTAYLRDQANARFF